MSITAENVDAKGSGLTQELLGFRNIERKLKLLRPRRDKLIVEALEEGKSHRQLAALTGLSPATIGEIGKKAKAA